jgi:hypothetical protein
VCVRVGRSHEHHELLYGGRRRVHCLCSTATPTCLHTTQLRVAHREGASARAAVVRSGVSLHIACCRRAHRLIMLLSCRQHFAALYALGAAREGRLGVCACAAVTHCPAIGEHPSLQPTPSARGVCVTSSPATDAGCKHTLAHAAASHVHCAGDGGRGRIATAWRACCAAAIAILLEYTCCKQAAAPFFVHEALA